MKVIHKELFELSDDVKLMMDDEIEITDILPKSNVFVLRIPFWVWEEEEEPFWESICIGCSLQDGVLYVREQDNDVNEELSNLNVLQTIVTSAFQEKSFISELEKPTNKSLKMNEEKEIFLSELKKWYTHQNMKMVDELPNENEAEQESLSLKSFLKMK